MKAAAVVGWKILRSRGSSIDAVEAAVVSMEDNPVFNAGTGSALNLAGNVEMDAAIMEGKRLNGGAVAVVRRVRNPVRLARIVMEKTNHVLLAGLAAERLALNHSIPSANPKTQDRIRAWKQGLKRFRRGQTGHLSRNYRSLGKGLLEGLDTVGALALDASGNLAAACSTGGLSLKLPGRIGDSAVLGAGLYADNSVGAATATGVGEIAIRAAVSKNACELMREYSAETSAKKSVRMAGERIGRGLGILALDRTGRHAAAHNTRHLCWAVLHGSGEPNANIVGTRV